MLPIRCFSCRHPLNHYTEYMALLDAGESFRDALTRAGFHRYCCRRMVLTYVEQLDSLLLRYETKDVRNDNYTKTTTVKHKQFVRAN